jgi:Ca2+:H+ antiporter
VAKGLVVDRTVAVPIASALLLGVTLALPAHPVLTLVSVGALMAVVLAAVHHAEVVAHRAWLPSGRRSRIGCRRA